MINAENCTTTTASFSILERALYFMFVRPVELLKDTFDCQTNKVEGAIVLAVLALTNLATHRGWQEIVGVLAVFYAWQHVSVANRLAEAAAQVPAAGQTDVHCQALLQSCLYKKEILWVVYFLLIGANAALVGCAVFLAYGPWRRLWRRYHPA